MMNPYSTPEIEAIREVAREFTSRELMPLERDVQLREILRAERNDPLVTGEENQRLTATARQQGLIGIDVPREYGGLGLTMLAKAVAIEEFNYSITPFRPAPESPNLFYLSSIASPSQREKYLQPYARGEKLSALALTEPDAGSDAGGIRTRAIRQNDAWILNGTKLWISWADTADFFIVIAVTDPAKGKRGGMTAFLVDHDAPGVLISAPILTMGEQRPFELRFEDVHLTDDSVLGEVGDAFRPLTNRLAVRRVDIGARCLGMSRRMIDMMCSYAQARTTFGTKLADKQAVQFMIADSEIDIQACRLLVYDTAARLDGGLTDIRLQASAVKVFATEMLTRTVDRAMQVHGAMGYSKELPIEYVYRNSRVLRILEGPSEIHRSQIAALRMKMTS
jgi:alkylation response protein AidB-like acyl-CoA dehydrogenase